MEYILIKETYLSQQNSGNRVSLWLQATLGLWQEIRELVQSIQYCEAAEAGDKRSNNYISATYLDIRCSVWPPRMCNETSYCQDNAFFIYRNPSTFRDRLESSARNPVIVVNPAPMLTNGCLPLEGDFPQTTCLLKVHFTLTRPFRLFAYQCCYSHIVANANTWR